MRSLAGRRPRADGSAARKRAKMQLSKACDEGGGLATQGPLVYNEK
jgi:hypothetical protein